ncbi:quinon protein alcohol dehydrogenase-like superfamily [Limtongia smithiae]|uniref:quinon protein alcohol dehydrogenase-like superfamily n=1 Tax=Limtongia smithiae TaxID=1125753 RepID=UPI0034CE960F
MPDPFFTRKRPRAVSSSAPRRTQQRQIRSQARGSSPREPAALAPVADDDEEITDPESSDEDGDRAMASPASDAEDEDAETSNNDEEEGGAAEQNETAADRRRRLAQQYLDNLRQEVDTEGVDAADVDRDLLAARLQADVAEDQGKLYKFVAGEYVFARPRRRFLAVHKMAPVTGVAAAEGVVYAVTKDRMLAQFEAGTGRLLHKARIPPPPSGRTHGSRKEIIALATSSDGAVVATGSNDGSISVFTTGFMHTDLSHAGTLTQHRGAVQGLAFRRGTHTLYSASADRTIKSWACDALSYNETLFGHQDTVCGIAALAQERCVTVGARDRTARVWKIAEESQLLFKLGNPPKSAPQADGSLDVVAIVDHHIFITGSDAGALALWTLQKKRPQCVIPRAHGVEAKKIGTWTADIQLASEPAPSVPQARGITCLAALPYGDVVVTGSTDGVRVWRVVIGGGEKDGVPAKRTYGLECITKVGMQGIVNGVAVEEMADGVGLRVCCAVGSETRSGRWTTTKARNGVAVLEFARR